MREWDREKGPAIGGALEAQPAHEETSLGNWPWPPRVGVQAGEKGATPPPCRPRRHTAHAAANPRGRADGSAEAHALEHTALPIPNGTAMTVINVIMDAVPDFQDLCHLQPLHM